MTAPRLVLALGGGGARGLAHVGVIEVLEREGIEPSAIAGTSMGAVIGALHGSGLRAVEIARIASSFRFPRRFIPGGLVAWDSIFPGALPVLEGLEFSRLRCGLAVTAVDLEAGTQVVLRSGPVLPALRASCAVPGILPPIRLDDRWLVDGGVLNVLPLDVAWALQPDVVLAVRIGGGRARAMPALSWLTTSWLSRLGRILPNPATAKVALEVLARSAEIALDRQIALASMMTGPELLVHVELRDVGLRDFDRAPEVIAAGRNAAARLLPRLLDRLRDPPRRTPSRRSVSLRFDPVCGMVVNATHPPAQLRVGGVAYVFCSRVCREAFERSPERYERDRREVPGGNEELAHPPR